MTNKIWIFLSFFLTFDSGFCQVEFADNNSSTNVNSDKSTINLSIKTSQTNQSTRSLTGSLPDHSQFQATEDSRPTGKFQNEILQFLSDGNRIFNPDARAQFAPDFEQRFQPLRINNFREPPEPQLIKQRNTDNALKYSTRQGIISPQDYHESQSERAPAVVGQESAEDVYSRIQSQIFGTADLRRNTEPTVCGLGIQNGFNSHLVNPRLFQNWEVNPNGDGRRLLQSPDVNQILFGGQAPISHNLQK